MPFFLFLFFFFFFPHSTSTPLCHSPPTFPFSFTRGIGHPSFQINCSYSSSNTSLLLLSSNSFPLLSSTSHSLTLSLPFLPHSPINLSSTPFHLSPSSCPSFSHFFLNQCHHHHSPNSSSLPLPASFQLLFNPRTDPYFIRCYNSCRRRICGYDDSLLSKPFRCLAGHRNWNRSLFICVFLLLLASTVVVLVWALAFFRREVNPPVGEDHSMLAFLRRHRLPNFSYDELSTATAGFDSKRKIGDGGFGSVFLAYFDGGRVAAVKRLHRRHPDLAGKSFCNEILILSSLRHPNLVRLHGYCCDPRGLLLVYDYVPNGTLSEHLHSGCSGELQWNVRVDVALQIATALEYLHFTVKPPVVHRDVTTSNVFVDKEMQVKVGDFGLSRLLCLPEGGTECVWTGPQGTPGYLDPDYHRSFRLTEKSDVYSFGVVLLELITGMRAVDTTRDKGEVGLADMVVSKIQMGELQKVIDPVLVRRGEGMGMVDAVAELAFRCLADNKDDRPDARELVVELRRINNRTQDASCC